MNTYEEQSQKGVGEHARFGEHGREREGKIAKRIEKRTARLPSDLFLWAAGAAVLGSLALEVVGFRERRGIRRFAQPAKSQAFAPLASFVGMWVPSLLLLGVYNKIVKVAGSDRFER